MFEPIYMTESKVTLGETDFEAEVSGVTLVPSYTTGKWKGLKSGSTFQKSGKADWAAGLNFGQDHETATALSVYLFEHEGETVPYSIEPVDGGAAYSGTLILQAGTIGGDVDQFGTASVTLPVIGKPTRTAPSA